MLGVQPSGGIRSRSLHVPHSERMIHNSHGRRARRRNNRKIESCSGATKFVSLSILVLFSVLVLSAGARSAIQAKRRRNNNHNNKYHDISLGKASNLRGAAIAVDRYPKFNEKDAAKAADHLIVVAGHSVIMPTLPSNNHGCDQKNVIDQKNINNDSRLNYFQEESAWYLLPYQRGQGLPQAILSHIQAGIDVARKDRRSLLIFSGGETRSSMGPITEGSSYFRVADSLNLWDAHDNEVDMSNNVRARTVTEEFATDSFENLLFSICRFYEVTGSYPKHITMVSFSFKEYRFRSLHIPALRWPEKRFDYIGVDPDPSTGFDLSRSSEGELKNAAAPFESDPYGCSTPVLQQKRLDRNPFSRTPPYELSCPAMKDIFHWCGPEIFQESLPWLS